MLALCKHMLIIIAAIQINEKTVIYIWWALCAQKLVAYKQISHVPFMHVSHVLFTQISHELHDDCQKKRWNTGQRSS